MKKPIQLVEGEFVVVEYRQFKKRPYADIQLSCCHCGLTHRFMFFPAKTRLHFVGWIDRRVTANKRRAKKFIKWLSTQGQLPT